MSAPSEKSPWILEATDEPAFQRDAVERSREVLVVVDFWAQWCQPCRMLGPILEKLAQEYAGKFLLVKTDTDKLPNIAAGFGVQSIPAVYAMRDGQLLDFFVGLLPEGQIRDWIDRLLPSEAELLVAQARKLEASDPKQAEEKYLEASRLDPNLASAKIGLATLLFSRGRADESRAILEELERRGFLEPDAEKLKAQLNVMSQGQTAGDLAMLQTTVMANPGDLQAKLALAEALAAQAQYEQALETALAVVQAGKKEFVEPARKLMVDIFRLLPDESELVTTYRRRLSTALY
ncbi:MAG: tetratricopeptide repeat protein [Planctomycetia bacterium]|nr:tetratricopeptide repeat protein [Planctomycetia bacterium]